MEYENLWGIENNAELENLSFTNNIVNIMKDQCQYLKKITGNKVFAKFARIKMISPLSSVASVLLQTEFSKTISMYSPKEAVGDDNNTVQLKDANVLYDECRYGFEVYNHSYKFRVFELQMEPVYPVSIVLDEGINETIKETLLNMGIRLTEDNKYSVSSDEVFMDFLRPVLNNKKIKMIIYRMSNDNS